MRAAIFLLITMIAGIFGAGCATPSKCRPAEVAPGILDGCKPRTQEDFETLRKQGIRTILSLETLPWNIRPERRLARKNGIAYRNVPILASPLKPREKRVKEALLTLADESLHPIFLHCFLGEDRDVFIVGLYRIYYQHWTTEAAWEEMMRSKFHVRRSLRGFETYFWSHTHVPDWVESAKPKTDSR